MINHKIFEWLRGFDEDYLKELKDLIESPYFNSKKKVKALFEIIYSTKPEFTGKKLEMKNLLGKLFPGKENTSEQALKNLFSDISGLIKEFIIQKGLKKNEYVRESLYADELFYLSKYNEGVKHANYMLNKFKNEDAFSSQYLDTYSKTISNLARSLEMDNQHFETMELPTRLYEIFLLKLVYDFIDLKNSVGTYDNSEMGAAIPEFVNTFEKNFNLKEIIDSLIKHDAKNSEILEIYHNIFLMLHKEENDAKLFSATKEKVYKNIDKVSYDEKYFLQMILLNYIYTRLGIEEPKYFKEAFEIIKFFLENGVFKYPGSPYMTNLNYENIYSCSTFGEDHRWTEKFLNDYKQYLKPEQRDISYHKNMASHMLSIKNYDAALKHINSYKADDIYEKLFIKLYSIIIFYEKGDFEMSLYEFDALIHYFKYNTEKIPKNVDKILKNMMPYMKKVLLAKANDKKIEYADYVKFKEAPDILYRRWVLKKMEEMLE